MGHVLMTDRLYAHIFSVLSCEEDKTYPFPGFLKVSNLALT